MTFMARSVLLFLGWTLVGFIASFALLYGFTPAGPVIVVVVWLSYRYLPTISGSRRPEVYGGVAGLGVFWLFVSTTVDGDPLPFAVVGALAVMSSILCYIAAARARCVKTAVPS